MVGGSACVSLLGGVPVIFVLVLLPPMVDVIGLDVRREDVFESLPDAGCGGGMGCGVVGEVGDVVVELLLIDIVAQGLKSFLDEAEVPTCFGVGVGVCFEELVGGVA